MEAYGGEGSPRDDGSSPNPVSAALRHKYRPGAWRYNARVACVLVPSTLMVVFSGGNAMVGTALTGTALVYVFDLLGSAEAALAAVWVTAFALYVATMANGDVFASHRSATTSGLLLLAHAQTLFTASAWATLQFRWVQTSFPGVTLACERFLFLVTPLIAGQVLGGWGAAALFGVRAIAWAQLAVQTTCFGAFSLPAESSFRVNRRRHKEKNDSERRSTGTSSTQERGAKTEEVETPSKEADRLILRDVDVQTHAALFCAAPFLSYAATHKNTLFSFSNSYVSSALLFEHVCSSALLLAFPPALMSLAVKQGGLRWAFAGSRDEKKTPKENPRADKDSARNLAAKTSDLAAEFGRRAFESPPTRNTQTGPSYAVFAARKRQRRLVTIVVCSLSLAIFAFGALGRVIASGFREYVVLPSPYGYLAVAAAAYGGMLACASFLTNAVPLPVTAATMCVSAVAAAAAIGVPTWLLPAAAASAWGLTRFVADDARGDSSVASSKATDYALFVCGAAACAARFLEDNFGLLDVELDEMPIRDLTRFLLLNVAACLAAPGAAATSFSATTGPRREKRISPKAFGAALGLHALMFARCEDALHSSVHEDGTSMYPPYLVAATTVLGTVAAEALRSRGAVTELTAWFVKCVYVAKLFVLFVPGEDALVPCTLVALAFTSTSHGGAESRHDADGKEGHDEHEVVYQDKRRVAAEDLARVFFIFFSLVHARFVAFDVAFALTGRRPTDATVFGGLVLCAACGLTPLVAKRHAHNAAAKRALAVAFASGAALVILKPPMPWKGEADGFWYDLEHVPDFEPDDADVYGDRAIGIVTGSDASLTRNGWATWALACAALAAAYCATSKGAGDVVGGAGWAPLGSFMRFAGVDVAIRGVFAAEARRASRFPTRAVRNGVSSVAVMRKPMTKTTFASLFSLRETRGNAVAFAAACVAFLETATLRSGVALAGGYAFGAYLGAETFPGAGRTLTNPLCLACAACAWLLAHVASPETNARDAGPAARLAFGAGALCVIAAGWSQRDAGMMSTDPKNIDISFAEARDERLRREEARLGVLGVAVGLAAMVAFALKAAGGGAGGDARARARGAATGRAFGGGDDDDGIDDSDADSDSDSDSYSDSGDDSRSRRRLRRRRVAPERGEDPPEEKNKNKNKNGVFGESGHKRSPFAPFSGRRPAHLRGVDAELRRRALLSRRAEWIPALGNVAAACSFLTGSALAARVATDADAAVFVVAPALLMLHEDGKVFPSLRGARRYAPPLAAVATQLLGAATSDALALGFGAPESELRAAATAAWGAGETFSSYQKWRAFLWEMILALAAAPCAWRLTEYLWSPARRARAAETAALAPLNVLTLAAARSRAAKTLAVTSLLCAAAQHVAQRSAKRAGMRAL